MSASADTPIVERLAQHRALAEAPRHELEWLAARGQFMSLDRGEVYVRQSAPIDRLYVLLSGHLTIHVNKGGGPQKVMEWRAGDLSGVLPYSRMSVSPGDVVAQEPSELWLLGREHLPDLIRDCHCITSICVHVMLDRARHFTSTDLQTEKMASLGKLAAGLAHELNNPASAVARNARELQTAVLELESASRGLGATGLTAEQITTIDELRARCVRTPLRQHESALQRSDREEAVAGWLEDHVADVAMAGPLSESSATLEDLNGLAATLSGAQLVAALRWIAAGCQVRQLISETETAAARVHTLVAAVKGFTYMDQAAVPAPVDLGKGLSDTIAVLAAKARAKSVTLTLDLPPGLPRVQAIGGELNQVWANLIENALDAVAEHGAVAVTASEEGGGVVVRVIDDGPGIPPDIRSRIFDPFFTTKPVGQGTGLGLDIVRRLVRRAGGAIDVQSEPGRTEFQVTLTLSPPAQGQRGEPK